MRNLELLHCPRCHMSLQITDNDIIHDSIERGELICKKGHRWTITNGIPSLIHPPINKNDEKWALEYNKLAENYNEMIKIYDEWLGINMQRERENVFRSIISNEALRIVDITIGTAFNFVALANIIGDAIMSYDLHRVDLSSGMVNVSRGKMQSLGLDAEIVLANLINMPYKKNCFDIVIHTGGINTFSNKARTMEEMLRVARPEGVILIMDVGLSPEMRNSDRGRNIIETNSLFASRPPLESIPDKARDVELKYIMNGTFYQIVFKK